MKGVLKDDYFASFTSRSVSVYKVTGVTDNYVTTIHSWYSVGGSISTCVESFQLEEMGGWVPISKEVYNKTIDAINDYYLSLSGFQSNYLNKIKSIYNDEGIGELFCSY